MSFLYKSLQWKNQCCVLLPNWQLPIWTYTSNYLLSPKCPRTQVRRDYFWNVYNRLTATEKTNSLSCNELKKPGNESLSGGAAGAHLNFSSDADAEVPMSSALGRKKEGRFWGYELSEVQEKKASGTKSKPRGVLVSILDFYCGKRKENLQKEWLHKTPALAQLQPINVAVKCSSLLLVKYDTPDTPKHLGTSSHSCEHGFTGVIASRIKSKL